MLKQLVSRMTATPLVGLDLGSSALKVVHLEREDGQLILRRAGVIKTETGDRTLLLKQLFRDAEISTRQVALAVGSPEVVVKPLDFPPMPKPELASAVKLEAEQASLDGHTLDGMAMDWHSFPAASGERIEALLAVVPKTVVTSRVQTVKAAGLRPAVVDVEGLALWNAYWTLSGHREPAGRTVLLLNVGAKTTNLVIAKAPWQLILIRDIQMGARQLEQGQQVDWVGELRDSLTYARSKGGLRALDAAYVTGGGSGASVVSLVQSAVATPVALWNPLDHLRADERVDATIGPLLTVAIGLALRHA